MEGATIAMWMKVGGEDKFSSLFRLMYIFYIFLIAPNINDMSIKDVKKWLNTGAFSKTELK